MIIIFSSDFKTALVGSFQDGVLEAAKATTLKTVIDDRGMKIPIFNGHDTEDGPIYKRDVSKRKFQGECWVVFNFFFFFLIQGVVI